MGNCHPSARQHHHRSPPPPSPSPSPVPPPARAATASAANGDHQVVRIYGSGGCPVAWRLRVALLYKADAAVHFTPSEATPLGRPVLRFAAGEPELTGSAEELLRHVDARFEGKPRVSSSPPAARVTAAAAAEEVEEMVRLQHRSMERHMEGVVGKVAEMARKVGKKAKGKGAVVVTAEAAEVRRVGRWYGDAMEVMLEHARMEEKLLFPDLERAAHPGVCDVANEQHGRHLPMMNGIKEDIKTLLTLELGSPLFQEVLINLSVRLKALQDHCKEHFIDEERELLPQLEAVRRMQREEGDISNKSNLRWATQVMEAMEATHSPLFPFFMAGLLPQEAMQYVDLVCKCTRNTRQLVAMLRSLAERLEDTNPSIIHNNPIKLYEHLLVSSP